MGLIKKQSSQTTLIAYAGIIIGFVGSALIRPKFLDESEIGLLQLVLNTTALFSSIFTLGTNLTTLKMVPAFVNQPSKKKSFISFSVILGIIGLIISIPIFFGLKQFIFKPEDGGLPNFDYSTHFFWAILLVIGFRIFQNILDAYLRTIHQPLPGVFAESIIQKFFPIIGLLLYYYEYINFQELIYFNLFIFGIPILVSAYKLYQSKAFELRKPGPFTSEEKKTIAGISMSGVLEILSGGLILYIDSYMIQWLLGEASVGIYTTLFFFGLVISVPAKSVRRISIITLSEAISKGDFSTINTIYKKSSQTLLVIGGLLFLGIWCNRYSVEAYLGDSYAQEISIILFIGLAQLVDCITSVNYQIIAVSKHYYYNLFIGFMTLALLVLSNYILIPIMGVTGAALASLISMSLINVLRFWFLKSKYQLSPFSSSSLKTLAIIFGVLAVVDFIPNLNNLYLNLLFKGLLVLIIYVPAIYFTKCSPDVNQIIQKYLNRLR